MLRPAIYRIIYTGIMFLAGLVLSNLVLPAIFGTVSLLVLNATILSIITGLGADTIILHKVSSNKWTISQAVRFAWRTIAIQVVVFLVLAIGSFMIRHRTLLSAEQFDYFFIEAIYFAGLLLAEKYIALLYSLHKGLLANLALSTIALVYFTILIGIYYFSSIDIITLLYLFAFQNLFQGLILVIIFHTNHKIAGGEKLGYDSYAVALKLSFVVMIANVIQLLAYRVDFWVLRYFYNDYNVGLYAQANKFANLMWIVPNIIAQLLIPKFGLTEEGQLPKIFGAAIYFNFFSLLATVVCAQFFYTFYIDPQYRESLSAFYLMLPGYFFWAGVVYFGAFFSWAGKFTYNLVCSSLCLVLIVLADLILIPSLGIKGAAIANTVVYTTVFIVYLIIIAKKYSFGLNELLLLRKKDMKSILHFLTR